jgi:hypothetical protein
MPILIASLMILVTVAGPPIPEPLGRFDARAISEASGIVKSRRYPGIFWVHNDSGHRPVLFAVKGDGRIVRRFRLAFPNLDWEDIAIDDQGHLYLGDIGNNTGLLRVRTVYRIDEPDPTRPEDKDRDHPLAATRTLSYILPQGNRFDAESLVYDRGNVILIAKYLDGREAELFVVPIDFPPSPAPPHAVPVTLIGKLPGFKEPATGAGLIEDGTLLAVCSYSVTRVYRRDESPRWRLLAEVRYEPLPIEGITWDGRDLILAAEEGRGLYRLTEAIWRAAAVARETRSDGATSKAR